MRVEHLDLDAGCVLVPESKTRKPRMAPLDPRACKALRVLLRTERIETGPLWHGERGPLTTAGVRQLLASPRRSPGARLAAGMGGRVAARRGLPGRRCRWPEDGARGSWSAGTPADWPPSCRWTSSSAAGPVDHGGTL